MNSHCQKILILLIAIVCTVLLRPSGVAKASGSWPNEPPGFSALVDCPFSGSLCPGIWDAYNSASFATQASAPLSPNSVLDTYVDVGATEGNGQWGVALPDAKELYVGTWWSTNADFWGMCNNGNKMLFARRPQIDNNFLEWQGLPGQPKNILWAMQATYDNNHLSGAYGLCYSCGDGTGRLLPNVANGLVAAGSGWHKLEFYLKTSTTKTSRDGIIRWWVDGQLVGNYPGANLSPGGLQDFQINHTWDGTNCLLPPLRDLSKAWHHYWDHLRISTGQAAASADQPPGPPAAPRITVITAP